MSLLAQAQCPDSPCQSRSTPVTGIDIRFLKWKKTSVYSFIVFKLDRTVCQNLAFRIICLIVWAVPLVPWNNFRPVPALVSHFCVSQSKKTTCITKLSFNDQASSIILETASIEDLSKISKVSSNKDPFKGRDKNNGCPKKLFFFHKKVDLDHKKIVKIFLFCLKSMIDP